MPLNCICFIQRARSMENRTKKSMVKLQCPQRESGCHVFTLLHNTCVFTLHAQHTRVHFAACTTHACSLCCVHNTRVLLCMHNTRVFTLLHAQHTRVTLHAQHTRVHSACTTHACSLCCMHNTRVFTLLHAQHTRHAHTYTHVTLLQHHPKRLDLQRFQTRGGAATCSGTRGAV